MSDQRDQDPAGQDKPKRAYTMSDAALAQRRAAAQLSTGPRTEEGKARSSRNAWKHGEYSQIARVQEWQAMAPLWKATGKPCKTTCDQFPCSLVDDGLTKPGGDCLDRRVFVQAFDAIISTLHSGDVQHTHGMLAAQMSSAMEVLQQLRDEVAERGAIVDKPIVAKDGEVAGYVPIANPALPHYINLLDKLGLNLPELMLTPRAVSKQAQAEDAEDAVAALFGRLALAGGVGAGRTIEAEAQDVEDPDG